jgi:peptide/nickel transport system substrate-binding protein
VRSVFAVAAFALVLACTPGTSGSRAVAGGLAGYQPSAPSRPGGTAVLADFEYPATLDPLTAQTDLELRLGALAFAPLWGLGPGLQAYPDLAREVPTPANGRVRVAADRRSMTVDVRLVPGLRWSDGQPLTADDVIFTWQALADPATHGAAAGFDRIQRMDRRSATEVVWTLDGVDPAYLTLGAGLFVMPAHRLRSVAHAAWSRDAFFQRPDVVSGPFAALEAVPNDHIVFAANPHYADGRSASGAYGGAAPFTHAPYLQRVVFEAQPSKDAELDVLHAQTADVGFHLLPADLQELQGTPGLKTSAATGLRDEFLNPNHGASRPGGPAPPRMSDPSVLQALEMALDRGALVRGLLAGTGRPARGLFPRALADFASGVALPSGRDLEGAKRLLDAAGWAAGSDGVRAKGGRRLSFGLVGICSRDGLAQELDLIRRQWLDVGAAVTVGCDQHDAFLQRGASGAFDMTVYSNQWAPDPSAWAAVGLSGAAGNWNRCQDRPLDAALTRGGSTLDLAARRAAYREAETDWLRSGCTIPLFEQPEALAISSSLRNFAVNPVGDTWNAADWWVTSS